MAKKKKQETKGYYLYIGVALGLIYGVIFNKIWLGLGIGLVIGVGFDFLMKQDKKRSKWMHVTMSIYFFFYL